MMLYRCEPRCAVPCEVAAAASVLGGCRRAFWLAVTVRDAGNGNCGHGWAESRDQRNFLLGKDLGQQLGLHKRQGHKITWLSSSSHILLFLYAIYL
jgi:hypothetical protein